VSLQQNSADNPPLGWMQIQSIEHSDFLLLSEHLGLMASQHFAITKRRSGQYEFIPPDPQF